MQDAKNPPTALSAQALAELTDKIRAWSKALGFEAMTISDTDLAEDETHLLNWLDAGHHGEMEYMARHGTKRSRPAELEPGTLRVISVRMDYLVNDQHQAEDCLNDSTLGYISRYAMGRDYHKVLRQRLQKLATKIEQAVGPFSYRAFTDSAPVLEKALAQKSGMGWIGKHTNLINQKAGSWFFLGELYTDLPL
ncbi:Epoxyqueuosine reductase, partial [hydrothermal vent metagenome]